MVDANGDDVQALIETGSIVSQDLDVQTEAFVVSGDNATVDLSGVLDRAELFITVVDGGNDGAGAMNGNDDKPPRPGGAGGQSGTVYHNQMLMSEFRNQYGNTFTLNGNNFDGTTIIEPVIGGICGEDLNGTPGGTIDAAELDQLNTTYPGLIFSSGNGGAGGSRYSNNGAGGGGGGAGGVLIAIDSANDPTDEGLVIPDEVSGARANYWNGGPEPHDNSQPFPGGGYAGYGGRGFGAGGGGSGAGSNYSSNPGSAGSPGAGADPVVIIYAVTRTNTLTFAQTLNLNYFKTDDQLLEDDVAISYVVEDADVPNKQMKIDGLTWDYPTCKTTKQGTGVVESVSAEDSTMTLSTTNNAWVVGYYAKGPLKNAVQMTAYLDFNASGYDVDIKSFYQAPVLMDNLVSPTINFPDEFSTGEAPDVDLPYPTYLQTFVQMGNRIGQSPIVPSNLLFPQTTGEVTFGPTHFRYTKEEFGQFCRWACSADYRSAIVTIQETTETVNELRDKAELLAQEYINRQS
jgi:hypothetical protein